MTDFEQAQIQIMRDETEDLGDELQPDATTKLQEAKVWRDNGWTARVIKNPDDEGWAVEMLKDGEPEPALVGPWTMGRDKKNPKPLDVTAFHTLVKTATEVLRRHEQQLQATLHKSLILDTSQGEMAIALEIIPDEEFPYALLTACDSDGEKIAEAKVATDFKLNTANASKWVDGGFREP